jgi:hypothetical protein
MAGSKKLQMRYYRSPRLLDPTTRNGPRLWDLWGRQQLPRDVTVCKCDRVKARRIYYRLIIPEISRMSYSERLDTHWVVLHRYYKHIVASNKPCACGWFALQGESR